MKKTPFVACLLVSALAAVPAFAQRDTVKVYAAAVVKTPLTAIAADFEKATGNKVTVVYDTAGATEIIFALFDLLGYRFTPRLRDLSDRRLFTSGTIDMQRYPRLQPP